MLIFVFIFLIFTYNLKDVTSNYAIVTLITGSSEHSIGFVQGALTLGKSLLDTGSILPRIALVTPDVKLELLSVLGQLWTIEKVKPIKCVAKPEFSPGQITSSYSIGDYNPKNQLSDGYFTNIERWKNTCTKLHVWNLLKYDRIIFMDSDMIAIQSIDDIFKRYDNPFLAVPETNSPDSFNSGFMVIAPNRVLFNKLLAWNEDLGTLDGGDQGLLNRALCPNYGLAARAVSNATMLEEFRQSGVWREQFCGKLPFVYNVPSFKYSNYKQKLTTVFRRNDRECIAPDRSTSEEIFTKNTDDSSTSSTKHSSSDKHNLGRVAPCLTQKQSVVRVIHYLSSAYDKPWWILHFEERGLEIPEGNARDLQQQREAHLLWRTIYFNITRITPPEHSIFV